MYLTKFNFESKKLQNTFADTLNNIAHIIID